MKHLSTCLALLLLTCLAYGGQCPCVQKYGTCIPGVTCGPAGCPGGNCAPQPSPGVLAVVRPGPLQTILPPRPLAQPAQAGSRPR